MVNVSVPDNATMISMLDWTNEITGIGNGEWGIAIFMIFFTFVIPFMYLTSIGQNKTEVAMLCSVISAVLMFLLSLTGIVPETAVVTMILLGGVAAVLHYFESK
jgi:hypothetical protein